MLALAARPASETSLIVSSQSRPRVLKLVAESQDVVQHAQLSGASGATSSRYNNNGSDIRIHAE